jgi:hypothetical protein
MPTILVHAKRARVSHLSRIGEAPRTVTQNAVGERVAVVPAGGSARPARVKLFKIFRVRLKAGRITWLPISRQGRPGWIFRREHEPLVFCWSM